MSSLLTFIRSLLQMDTIPTTAAEYNERDQIPVPEVKPVNSRAVRPQIVGPDTPEPPFPIPLAGLVQKGFGRGGKDLGCPTANLPDESITPISTVAQTGVYYGWAQVIPPPERRADFTVDELIVLPMVMSLGWNPFYKNKQLTAEIHIMHPFKSDFYGLEMKAIVLGYIRPELDYISREALIEDIDIDKKVAMNCLQRSEYQIYARDHHFNLTKPEVKASM